MPVTFQPPVRAPRSPAPLSRRQKAAVVIHLLVSGGADPGLRDLPPEQQRQLVRDMAQLRFVDRETLAGIIAEFAEELDSIGLHFPRDPAKILALLESQLSLDIVDEMSALLGDAGASGAGPWKQVTALDDAALLEVVTKESDEVCAVFLSKLPAPRAAEIIALIPKDRAEGITSAFARTETISPRAVAQIGIALGRESSTQPPQAFKSDGVRRVGAILNAATSAVRRDILDRLDVSDPEFARKVRIVVFSFENIPARIDPGDLPKVLRSVENTVLVTALAGLAPEQAGVMDFMLGSISKRLAEQIREEVEERRAPTTDEHEAALSEIVGAIRQLEEDGEIVLLVPEEGGVT